MNLAAKLRWCHSSMSVEKLLVWLMLYQTLVMCLLKLGFGLVWSLLGPPLLITLIYLILVVTARGNSLSRCRSSFPQQTQKKKQKSIVLLSIWFSWILLSGFPPLQSRKIYAYVLTPCFSLTWDIHSYVRLCSNCNSNGYVICKLICKVFWILICICFVLQSYRYYCDRICNHSTMHASHQRVEVLVRTSYFSLL